MGVGLIKRRPNKAKNNVREVFMFKPEMRWIGGVIDIDERAWKKCEHLRREQEEFTTFFNKLGVVFLVIIAVAIVLRIMLLK